MWCLITILFGTFLIFGHWIVIDNEVFMTNLSHWHTIVVDWNLIDTSSYQSGFIIPQRVVLSIMGFLAIVNAYTMRICLNIAITEMVKKEVLNNSTDSSEYCVAEGGESEDSIGGGEYVWSETLQGVVRFFLNKIV